MPELWIPGAAGPSMDDFVERIHRQIERFVDQHASKQALVEVELHDGSRFALDTLSPEPGYSFVTLRPHPQEGEPARELIVPVGSIVRITLGEPEEHRASFGFTLPEKA